jgi:hypothetical protein
MEDRPCSDTQNLVNLHIAEYQALTTRCTYWITLQSALWPILILSLGLFAQMENFIEREVIIWCAATVVQVIAIAYYSAMLEHYTAVCYIEQKLRPLVETAIGQYSFWQYEPNLKGQRAQNPALWEYFPFILSFAALALASFFAFPYRSVWSAIGFLLNAGGVYSCWRSAAKSSQLRRDFFVDQTTVIDEAK